MTIAIPNFQGRVSPVFDVAARLVLVRAKNGISERVEVTLADTEPLALARRVVDLRVDVLICGAISQPLQAALLHAGVRVLPEICGPIEEVIRAFIAGNLHESDFRMPGWCGRRWAKNGSPCKRRSKQKTNT